MAAILNHHGLVNRQFVTIVPGARPEDPEGTRATVTRTMTVIASTLAPLLPASPLPPPPPLPLPPPRLSPSSPSSAAFFSSSSATYPVSPTSTSQIDLSSDQLSGQTQPSASSAPLPPHLDPSLPHTDLGPLLNSIFWTLTMLALLFLALRIHVKVSRANVSLWWDDHLLIASWIALAVSAGTTSACVALDYGKYLYDMDPAHLPLMPFIAVFAGFFSVLAAAWSKTSFALTLLRLANSTTTMGTGESSVSSIRSSTTGAGRIGMRRRKRRTTRGNYLKYLIWFIILSVNGILGVAMLTMWIKCWPIAKIWDGSISGGWCMDPQAIIVLYQWSAGWSGAMDIVLALCPWVILWRLTMTMRDKFGVAVAMSMGVVAGIASFVKMGMLPQLAGDPVDTVAVTIWGGAEGAITIMAASIPVLRTLFRRTRDFTPLELPASSSLSYSSPGLDSPARAVMLRDRERERDDTLATWACSDRTITTATTSTNTNTSNTISISPV